MDKIATETPGMPGPLVRNALRFEGSAGEYFKIWIVNLALTIVTLGIFSAWAKVRSRRYLYGNTYVGAHSFDYHAVPWRILLGRVIALALLLGYSLTAAFAPKAVFLWVILFVAALPWLVRASLRFNARNTSYRNIRFDFVGTYGGAFKAFLLWPILAVITLYTTLPLAHRARDYYNINNHRFGGKAFEAEISAGKLYLIYLMGLVFLMAVAVAATAAVATSGLAATFIPGHHAGALPPTIIPMMILMVALYVAVVLFLYGFLGTMTFNLAVSSTRLDDRYQLESDLAPLAMVWIVFSNLLATVCSLGLLYPWARIRQTRYTVSHLAITGPADMEGFASSLASGQGAVGEEIASFFDIDFSL